MYNNIETVSHCILDLFHHFHYIKGDKNRFPKFGKVLVFMDAKWYLSTKIQLGTIIPLVLSL